MSISSSGARKSGPYTGNGGATAFPFTFKVFKGSDVLVVQTDTTPADHTLVLNTDYTVTLNANQDANPGGTVNMVLAPPSGYLLTIGSNVAELQSVTLTNNGGFYPTVVNTALDYLTILIQQLSEKIGRALVMPFSTNASGQLPPVAPGQLLGWKADGTGIDNVGASGVGAGSIVASNMAAGATGNALSTDTQAASAKATPADADALPLFDSADFWQLKRLTLANLKTALAALTGTWAISTTGNAATSSSLNGIGDSTAFDARYAPINAMPAGTIIDYAGTSAPSGYLPCDGTAYSRTGTYAALFAAIGITWGAGDGTTTFNVPNIPADFASVQANANVGTSTNGVVKNHTHTDKPTGPVGFATFGSSAYPFQSVTTGTPPNAPEGGLNNLAAGVRVLKCIRY